MSIAAMIFAAGFGTRMGELTARTPKPMLPLAGKPMIDHAIDHIRTAGIDRIVANTHYLAERMTPHLKSRGLVVCHEDPILETGGGLRAALPRLGTDPVVTMNPDAVWIGSNPVQQLLANWRDDMQALLMLVPSPEGHHSDDFSLEQGEIRRSGPYRYTGLQIIRTSGLAEIDADVFSLKLYWDRLAQAGPLHGHVYNDGTWCDIGTPAGLSEAERRLA